MQLSTKHSPIFAKLKKYAISGVPPSIRTKLNSMYDSEELSFIYDELSRIATPCLTDVDTSDFAMFTTKRFTHNNVTFIIDRIGKVILKNEMKLYDNQYTQGVHEAITCSENYSKYLDKLQKLNPDSFYKVSQIPHYESTTTISSNGRRTHVSINPAFNIKNFIYRSTLAKKTEIFTMFCCLNKGFLTPEYELESNSNTGSRNLFDIKSEFQINEIVWANISRDLLNNDQIFVFKSTIKINGAIRTFIATSEQLTESELVNTFIQSSVSHGSLEVYQLNISELIEKDTEKLINSFKLKRRQIPVKTSHTIHVRKLTHHLHDFNIPKNNKNDYLKIKRFELHPGRNCFIKSLKESNERRLNERYLFETEVSVKLGAFTKCSATLLDYSEQGAKIKFLQKPKCNFTTLRIKIKDFKYKFFNFVGVNYDVVDFNPKTLEARLVLAKGLTNKRTAKSVLKENLGRLEPFSLFAITKAHISIFSELSLFNLPGIHIYCKKSTSLSTALNVGISNSPINSESKFLKDESIKLGELFNSNIKKPLSENIFESIKNIKPYSDTVWNITFKNPQNINFIKCLSEVCLPAKTKGYYSNFEISYRPIDNIVQNFSIDLLRNKGIVVDILDGANHPPKYEGLLSIYSCIELSCLLLNAEFSLKPTL